MGSSSTSLGLKGNISAGWGDGSVPVLRGASGRLVNAVATAAVVVHVATQVTFGRPTHLQQMMSSPQKSDPSSRSSCVLHCCYNCRARSEKKSAV